MDLGENVWTPLRRQLGATAFGLAAFSADSGKELIEPHDELSPGAGGHEELYVVVSGHAIFTVAGQDIHAPAGMLILVEKGVQREAMSAADGTTVLVVGGVPGAALPASPFEYWYLAQPAYAAGDYERAIEICSEGLADYPTHGGINYQLACYYSLAGRSEEALRHLGVAFENDPRTRDWAGSDSDLDSVRDRFPR